MNLIIEKKSNRDGAGYWVQSPIGEAELEPGMSRDRLRLTWFEVDSTQRGKGLGTYFLEQIQEAFPDKAIHPVNRLPDAEAFWQKMERRGLCKFCR